MAAATTLLLVEKTRLHAMMARVDDAALRASARFAAMACIILPLLPPGPYGPLDAIRPRELWALVLFFSGLSFAAWLARRLVGPDRGTIVAGVLGGLISSTSVTLNFAGSSQADDAPRLALAILLARWPTHRSTSAEAGPDSPLQLALTLSLARSSTAADALIAAALAAGVLANTGVKLAVALVIGRGAFRGVVSLTLGTMAAAMVAALLLWTGQ